MPRGVCHDGCVLIVVVGWAAGIMAAIADTPKAKKSQPVRLYTNGVMVGFRRGGANSGNHYNHTALIALEGVKQRTDTEFYMGKRVAYIYKVRLLSSRDPCV